MAPTDALAADVRRRRQALREAMDQHGIDAALITSEPNFTYLTGYVTASWANRSRPTGLIVLRDEDAAIGVLSAAEAESLTSLGVDVECAPVVDPLARPGDGAGVDYAHAVAHVLAEQLARRAVRRVATELGAPDIGGLPHDALTAVGDALDAQLTPVGPLLWPLRRRKSAFEVDCAARAATALGTAFAAFAAGARPGMTERELHGALIAAVGGSGADRMGYAMVVAGAANAPLGPPGDRVWDPGELLMVDVGVVVDGYWADFCRHFGAAHVTAAQEAAYAQLVDALHRGRDAVRAGATATSVAATMAAALPGGGTGDFGRVGHGVGLELAEPPSLHRSDPTVLEPGMTLCVEPMAWFDGVGHLVGEEMVAVTTNGAELLSPAFPHAIEVLG